MILFNEIDQPFRRCILFFITLAGWLVLTGEVKSLFVGIPTTIMVVLLTPLPNRDQRISWKNLPALLVFFAMNSIRGGTDVAWRAIRPGSMIVPGSCRYRLRLAPGLPRIMMANLVSLLPGTESWQLDDEWLTVHLLDDQLEVHGELRLLEDQIARFLPGNTDMGGEPQ